ncbi:MAG: hypothetical protein AAGD06_17335 [Acidobacteriota bacterium]
MRTIETTADRRRSLALVLAGLAWGVQLTWGIPASAQLGIQDLQWLPARSLEGRMGAAMAVADFDGDGFEDLAVGLPDADVGSALDIGVVQVFFGSRDGLLLPAQNLRESSFPLGNSETGDRFGAALAAADFDQDGFADLAIGIPGEDISGAANAGKVVVLYGQGLQALDTSRVTFFEASDLSGTAEPGDEFGAALAAGRLGGGFFPDLAIGVPGQEVGGFDGAGAVVVVRSTGPDGLETAGHRNLTQNTTGVFGIASPDDRFGTALAIGDVNQDFLGDLIIGSPGDLVGLEPGSGAVQMIPGGVGAVVIGPDQRLWNQDTAGLLGDAAGGDEFGAAVSLGDFNGDGLTDLAIGVPGESQFGPQESGAVQILFGGVGGLTTEDGQVLLESLLSPEVATFDRFGSALTTGDFNADGRDDLAVGMPLDNVLGTVNAGNVPVLYGGPSGLEVAGAQLWNGLFLLSLEPGDELGFAVAAGRFTGGPADDLAIGVPGREVDGQAQAGGALVLRSQSLFADDFESGGLSRWSQATRVETERP